MPYRRKTQKIRDNIHSIIRRAAYIVILQLVLGLSACASLRSDQKPQKESKPTISNETTARIVIIMYHSVRKGVESDYAVTPDTLRADFMYLRENHYSVVSAEDMLKFVYDSIPLPKNPVYLTFDDGFYNNLAYVLPLLEEFDFCATVNIVGEFTEQLAPADSHVPAYSYLTVEDCAALLASGRVTLGNHTTHFHHRETRSGCSILCGEDEARYHALLYSDLSYLQDFLASKLNCTPFVFAYPYGFECPESFPVLKDLGFLITLSCCEHPNILRQGAPDCLFGLGRYNRAGNQSSETFFHRIESD